MTPSAMVSFAHLIATSGSTLPPAPASQRTTSSGRAGPPAGSGIPPAPLMAATAASAASKISGWATTPDTAVGTANLIGAPWSFGAAVVGVSPPLAALLAPSPLPELQPVASTASTPTATSQRQDALLTIAP